ncbi:MAG: nucleoside monophosphate kinase [Alphaproteobacteria bacterium]|nr:nucleoside monophosphate kinase [Alphaproteobacteria bacterium]
MNKLILMMGGQGSGKGTLSKKFITENPNYDYIETGAMLRALPATHPLKAIIARGEFVPDQELQNLLLKKINPANNTILDGFPRQLSQAKWLVDTFADKFDMIAVYLNIPRELMLKRIQNRINEGAGRADDADAAAVQRRLDTFFTKTLPAIQWLGMNPNVKFIDVPIADASIEQNYNTMKQMLLSATNNKVH